MKELRSKIIQLRNAIRYPRDQKGDDRCWLDYYLLYKLLPGIKADELIIKPIYNKVIPICRAFYYRRRSDYLYPLPPDVINDRAKWDDDLAAMSIAEQMQELEKLHQEGLRHYKMPIFKLTMEDDKKLYNVLPEKVSCDFRLPPEEEFLGEKNPCAGCPNFWKSHENCKTNKHNLHEWGPCKKIKF